VNKPKEIKGLDANILLRFLTNDVPEQAERCEKLLEEVQAGNILVYLADITLADVIWTLEKYYKLPREDIRFAMTRIIECKGLQFSNKSQALAALDYYVDKNIDWTDSFMAAQLIDKGIKEIYTFDKHFKRFETLTKIEP